MRVVYAEVRQEASAEGGTPRGAADRAELRELGSIEEAGGTLYDAVGTRRPKRAKTRKPIIVWENEPIFCKFVASSFVSRGQLFHSSILHEDSTGAMIFSRLNSIAILTYVIILPASSFVFSLQGGRLVIREQGPTTRNRKLLYKALSARPDSSRPLGRIKPLSPSLTTRPYRTEVDDGDLLTPYSRTGAAPFAPILFPSPTLTSSLKAAPSLGAFFAATTAVTGTQVGATMLAFPHVASNLDASIGWTSLSPATASIFLISYALNLISGFYIVDCFTSSTSTIPPASYSSLTDAHFPILTPIIATSSTLINAGVLVFALYSFPAVIHEHILHDMTFSEISTAR